MATKINLSRATNAELAKHYRVSVSTIKSWQRKGYPVRDPEKLQIALDAQRSAPEITPSTPLAKARLEKVVAETERIRFELETAKGAWMPVEKVVHLADVWASQVRAEMMSLISEAPAAWAGLDPATLKDKATAFVTAILSRLHTFAAPKWEPTAEKSG